ncbi:MAG: hypothetical protein WCO09_02220 [bacterium]
MTSTMIPLTSDSASDLTPSRRQPTLVNTVPGTTSNTDGVLRHSTATGPVGPLTIGSGSVGMATVPHVPLIGSHVTIQGNQPSNGLGMAIPEEEGVSADGRDNTSTAHLIIPATVVPPADAVYQRVTRAASKSKAKAKAKDATAQRLRPKEEAEDVLLLRTSWIWKLSFQQMKKTFMRFMVITFRRMMTKIIPHGHMTTERNEWVLLRRLLPLYIWLLTLHRRQAVQVHVQALRDPKDLQRHLTLVFINRHQQVWHGLLLFLQLGLREFVQRSMRSLKAAFKLLTPIRSIAHASMEMTTNLITRARRDITAGIALRAAAGMMTTTSVRNIQEDTSIIQRSITEMMTTGTVLTAQALTQATLPTPRLISLGVGRVA